MNHLRDFIDSLSEHDTFPKDELRDYYLNPAKRILKDHPSIVEEVFNDKSAIMAIVEQQVKRNNHSIRQIHLDTLAMEVSMITPPEILNYQNMNGDSIVHLTTDMYCYSVSILDLMKESGANFSLINKKGETPLIKVSSTDSLDDLKFIHGYTKHRLLNHRDLISGSTALMTAIRNRKIANIFFLLDSGASLFIKDNTGISPIDLIQTQEYKQGSNKIFYKELLKFVDLFGQKQLAEENIKKISGLI